MKRILTLSVAVAAFLPAWSNDRAPAQKEASSEAATVNALISRLDPDVPGPRLYTPKGGESFLGVRSGAYARRQAPMRLSGAPVSIFGNFVSSTPPEGGTGRTGLWRFLTSGEFIPEKESLNPSAYASFEYNNEYYVYYLRADYTGLIMCYNMADWGFGGFFSIPASGIATVAAVDPVSGILYGVCYNSDLSGYRFCSISLAGWQFQPTEIQPLQENWHSFCFDSKGQAYALDYSGNLLKVNKGNGSTQLIGNTGIVPAYAGGAQIDPASGRLFWSVMLEDGTSHIYEVDTSTATATHQMQFEYNDQVTGLLIPNSRDRLTPAIPVNMGVECEAPSLSPTVRFDIPAYRSNGTEAAGEVEYTITYSTGNLFNTRTGSSAYGSEVSETIDLPFSNLWRFSVTLNEKGGPESDRNVVTEYIGYDIPCAPSVRAELSGNTMTVTWDAVTATLNDEYLDPGKVTYTVTRYPDNTEIAKGIKETSLTDRISSPQTGTAYYYGVKAIQEDSPASEEGLSNKIHFGVSELPYVNTFDYPTSFASLTVINVANDKYTWTWSSSSNGGYAFVDYMDDLSTDDWLITPPFMLQAGKTYKVAFDCNGLFAQFPEKLEVKYGTSATAEGMTSAIVPVFEIMTSTPERHEASFTVPSDGTYSIGFHACSDPYMGGLALDNISVTEAASGDTPAEVSDITLVAAADGAHTLTGTFTAPSRTRDGAVLTSIDAITVKRGDTTVETFEHPASGAVLTFKDNLPEAGDYTYTITAANSEGEGAAAEASAYVGVKLAKPVTDVTVAETDPGEVTVRWKGSVENVDGAPLLPGQVAYRVTDAVSGAVIAENITETTCTWKAAAEGQQALTSIRVSAVTERGESEAVRAGNLFVGTPWAAPYLDSFPGGYNAYPYGMQSSPGSYWTSTTSATSYDGDGGVVGAIFPGAGAEAMLYSGKIDLSTLESPVFSAYVYGHPEMENTVSVVVRAEDSDEWKTLLEPTPINSLTGENAGWARLTAPLKEYTGKSIQWGIRALAVSHKAVVCDAIRVDNMADTDITLSDFWGPSETVAGRPIEGTVSVTNNGLLDIASFTVGMSRGEEMLLTLASENLKAGDTRHIPFTIPTDITMEGETTLAAEAVADGDAVKGDNSGSLTVDIIGNALPVPTALKAENLSETVRLTWEVPAETEYRAFDDGSFESARSFGHSLEGWTFIDRDNKPTGGISGVRIPGLSTGRSKASFFVFDSSGEEWNQSYNAFDGTKFLAAMYAADDTETDDWAISPRLTGNAQTLRFKARSYSVSYREKIEVLYSSTDTDPDNFTLLMTENSVPLSYDANRNPVWTEYSVDLPEGARYFAIRSCAAGGFMLCLDGFEFEAATGADALVLKGYNIRRNGSIINESTAHTPEWTDIITERETVWEYNVSAIYAGGESRLSDPVSVSIGNGITETESGVCVTGEKGALTITAEGEHILISSASGIRIHDGRIKGHRRISVLPGTYIVTVEGGKAFKVLVR